MLGIGTYVSYRSEGVCVISDIRTETFGDKSGEYYILAPIKDANSVLYVPVDNDMLVSRMLPLLSASEISSLAEELKDERMEWRIESRARNYEFRDVLNSGDRRALIILVNTIADRAENAAVSGKKLTGGDENALKRARKMLFDEFSVTADIADEEQLMQVLSCQVKCQSRN